MDADFDIRTSKTLLEKLRVYEDSQAWSKFMQLYLPMIQAWGRRFDLKNQDAEELTSRLLTKLVEALPRFEYDPQKGSFRGWLKTITQRELVTFARQRNRSVKDQAAGGSVVYGMLLEHADDVDDLVASVHERSVGMLKGLQEAIKQIQNECEGEEEKSWVMFQRIVLSNQSIETVAAEFGLSYHATAMRVQRIKKKVRSKAMELALSSGRTP